jgi:hypothetical protein
MNRSASAGVAFPVAIEPGAFEHDDVSDMERKISSKAAILKKEYLIDTSFRFLDFERL